jgi:hypothetical protein
VTSIDISLPRSAARRTSPQDWGPVPLIGHNFRRDIEGFPVNSNRRAFRRTEDVCSENEVATLSRRFLPTRRFLWVALSRGSDYSRTVVCEAEQASACLPNKDVWSTKQWQPSPRFLGARGGSQGASSRHATGASQAQFSEQATCFAALPCLLPHISFCAIIFLGYTIVSGAYCWRSEPNQPDYFGEHFNILNQITGFVVVSWRRTSCVSN